MSGPIIRSGASPEFSKNWEKIFGGGKKSTARAAGKATKPAGAVAKPKAAKKAAAKGKKK